MEQIKALNVAIVGGGPGCKEIIDMIFAEKLSRLRMNLIGVACRNPEAVGYRYAQEKGFYTTEDYRDLYKLKDLDMIFELTGRDEVANEISRTMPGHVRLMDHVAANLFWNVIRVEPESVAALKLAEEKYKTLIEKSLTGIFIQQDGKYVFVNDRFAEIHGYTPGEIMGKDFLTLIHPDEREAIANVASKRLNGEAMPEWYEVRRLGRDGRTIWCEMIATLIEYEGRPAIMGNIIDISKRMQALEAVQQRDERLAGIISSVTDHMIMLDDKHNIVWANDIAKRLFGPDLVGKKCYSSYYGRKEICEPCMVKHCFEDGKVRQFETDIILPDGNQRTFWCTTSVAGWHIDGRPKLVVEISRDITERKQAEETLQDSFRQLQVAYDQSIIYAKELNEEMQERKQAEEALLKRKEELKAQTRTLEEMNTAMKVLLKHREEDKEELEEKVVTNVKKLVLPYVEALKKTRLGAEQVAYASIIESHLNDIISPFLRKLSSKHLGLTPKEIQVADLIKEGKTTKEIAGLLHKSVRAVEFHRENIRAKFGIKNKKANLRSYLLSLQ